MSRPIFRLWDEPSEMSVALLARSLSDDCVMKDVSPKNYAHRARVIRQQTERLAGKVARAAAQEGPSANEIFPHNPDGVEGLRNQAAACRRLALQSRTIAGASSMNALADHFDDQAIRLDQSERASTNRE